ncbi:MAG: flagellar biosynthesis regulator FlaF [Pseudomonadota bacterium]
MSAAYTANSAYGQAKIAVNSPRMIEYQAFAKITAQMSRIAAQEAPAHPELVAALHENRRLWTALAADLMLEDNQLPDMLRAQLVYLAEFTRAHTSKVMKGEADIVALIDINTTIMKGLRDTPEAASCPA